MNRTTARLGRAAMSCLVLAACVVTVATHRRHPRVTALAWGDGPSAPSYADLFADHVDTHPHLRDGATDVCGCFPGSNEPVCTDKCSGCMCALMDVHSVDAANEICWKECQ